MRVFLQWHETSSVLIDMHLIEFYFPFTKRFSEGFATADIGRNSRVPSSFIVTLIRYIWAMQKLREIRVHCRGLLSQFGKSGSCKNWEKFACTVNVYCHNSVNLGHAKIGRNSRLPSSFTATIRYIVAMHKLGEIRVYRRSLLSLFGTFGPRSN